MGKKLIFALVCLLCASGARAQIAVSANLKDLGLSNVGTSNTFVRFTLTNYGANIPRVIGTNLIVSDTKDFKPDTNGNISGTIQGNDTISPSSTGYRVCVYFNGSQFRCNNYLITSGLFPSGFNLNTATPVGSVLSASSLPLGARTYEFTQATPATVWTIAHGLNDSHPLTQCFDISGNVIYPDLVTVVDANTVRASFVTARTGACTVTSVGSLVVLTDISGAIVTNPSANQAISGNFDLAMPSGQFAAMAFRSSATAPALSGVLRLSSSDSVCWRNFANGADVCLGKNNSDQLTYNSSVVATLGQSNFWTQAQTFGTTAAFLGTPAFSITSNSVIANLNASLLLGSTWASPGAIGSTTPNQGAFTTVTVQGEQLNASPRVIYNAFIPNLTLASSTFERITLDKAITVTRVQMALGTAGSGCTGQATVRVTNGTTNIDLTTVNGTSFYDSGALSNGFVAAANLDVKIQTAASGCTTAPQNAGISIQYKMQ